MNDNEATTVTSVVVGDDHGVFVDALSTVLSQRRFRVLAVAHRVHDVLGAVRLARPEICLLDRWFGEVDGLDLIGDILAAGAGRTRVIVVTADPDPTLAGRALELGASGYVHKTRGVVALLDAMGTVLAGGTAIELPPRRRTASSGRCEADSESAHRLAGYLTDRERQCLTLLSQGLSTPELAATLGVSTTTVRTHVQNLMTKLGVHTRLEAVAVAQRHGLVVATAGPVGSGPASPR